jgi:acyl carrier protein
MERQEILAVLKEKVNQIKNNNNTISEDDFVDSRGVGLNSLELINLIVYIEEYFEFEMDDDYLTLEVFSYVSSIIDVIISGIEKKDNM